MRRQCPEELRSCGMVAAMFLTCKFGLHLNWQQKAKKKCAMQLLLPLCHSIHCYCQCCLQIALTNKKCGINRQDLRLLTTFVSIGHLVGGPALHLECDSFLFLSVASNTHLCLRQNNAKNCFHIVSCFPTVFCVPQILSFESDHLKHVSLGKFLFWCFWSCCNTFV